MYENHPERVLRVPHVRGRRQRRASVFLGELEATIRRRFIRRAKREEHHRAEVVHVWIALLDLERLLYMNERLAELAVLEGVTREIVLRERLSILPLDEIRRARTCRRPR